MTLRTPIEQQQQSTERLLMFGSVGLITCFAFESLATTNTMPTVVEDLGGDQWYSVAAGVVLAGQVISTVVAGAWNDAKGVKPSLVTGILLFTVGALIAGLAPSLPAFVTGRAVQGLGGGFVIVPLYVMIGALVEPERRPRFFAAFSYAWVVPSMVGPAVAGYIVDQWHWRPVYYLIIPVALAALLPLLPLLRHIPPPEPSDVTMPPLFSAILTATGIIALQLGGAYTGSAKWFLFGAGAALLVGFLPRLFPKGTAFARRGTPSIVATRFLLMAALVGTEFFLPFVLNRVHEWTASATGWAIALGSLTWTVGSWSQTHVVRPNRRRYIPIVGAGCVAVGTALALLLPHSDISPFIGLTGWAVIGLGMGLAIATTSDFALAITDKSRHGDVSASLQLADSTGPALAMGVISVALSLWVDQVSTANPYLPAPVIACLIGALAFGAAMRNRRLSW
ncbi:MAG: MFS transporter [Actinomycetaceae bacterium]|nr:MFS transporter [Actinomycetaceae bacterium]